MPRAPMTPMGPSGVPSNPPSPTDFLMAAADMHSSGALREIAQSPPPPRNPPLGTGRGARKGHIKVVR